MVKGESKDLYISICSKGYLKSPDVLQPACYTDEFNIKCENGYWCYINGTSKAWNEETVDIRHSINTGENRMKKQNNILAVIKI